VQGQQPVDGGARQQLEVAGVDGQLDGGAKADDAIGHSRQPHPRAVLAMPTRTDGMHDLDARSPLLEQRWNQFWRVL